MTAVIESDRDLSNHVDADTGIGDDELEALALAADPDQPIAPDAEPWTDVATGLMPGWYMAPGVARRRRGWRSVVVLVVIGAFIAINALGFCITYGQLVAA
jgi:hypothetical protein